MGASAGCVYENTDDAVGDNPDIVGSMPESRTNPLPKFKLVQKSVHLKKSVRDTPDDWGIGMNFKEHFEAWKISQCVPKNAQGQNLQGWKAGIRINWRVKKVNGIDLTAETAVDIKEILETGEAVDIVFEHLEPAWTPMMYTTTERLQLRFGPTNESRGAEFIAKEEIIFIDDAYLYGSELVGEVLEEIPKWDGQETSVDGWATIYSGKDDKVFVEPYKREP